MFQARAVPTRRPFSIAEIDSSSAAKRSSRRRSEAFA
jgi:hypothetical protein